MMLTRERSKSPLAISKEREGVCDSILPPEEPPFPKRITKGFVDEGENWGRMYTQFKDPVSNTTLISLMQNLNIECGPVSVATLIISKYSQLYPKGDPRILWPLLRNMISRQSAYLGPSGTSASEFIDRLQGTALDGTIKIMKSREWIEKAAEISCVSLEFDSHYCGHWVCFIPINANLGYLLEPASGHIFQVDTRNIINVAKKGNMDSPMMYLDDTKIQEVFHKIISGVELSMDGQFLTDIYSTSMSSAVAPAERKSQILQDLLSENGFSQDQIDKLKKILRDQGMEFDEPTIKGMCDGDLTELKAQIDMMDVSDEVQAAPETEPAEDALGGGSRKTKRKRRKTKKKRKSKKKKYKKRRSRRRKTKRRKI